MGRIVLPLLLAMLTASSYGETFYLPSVPGGRVSLPVLGLKQARAASTLLQQYDFSCGSAALATLLTHHYEVPVSEQEVFEDMYERGDQEKIQKEGFSLLDMKLYLETLGFDADGFEQPLDKLAEARIPAIVLVNEGGYHHFVVVKGIQGGRVLIGDPASGTRALSRDSFEAIWLNRLLFVIHSHMKSARFNLAADWRAAPSSPLSAGVSRDGMAGIALSKHGPGEF